MSQTTNDQNDSGYAWARRPEDEAVRQPPASALAAPAYQTDSSGSTTPVPVGAGYAGYSYASGPLPSAGPSADPAVGNGAGGLPPGEPGTPTRSPRRPGWGGVLAVGAGAAALSSLLTAGIVLQTQDPAATTTSTGTLSTSSPVKAPVTSSRVSNPDWGKVAAAVEPSVVSVQVTGQSASGEGSGVILDKTGRIITNNHVASGGGTGATIKVVLNDGRGYPATIVGTDPATDLAVLKITNPPGDLTPATLGSSGSIAVGDPVMAVGNPLGLAGTVTTGIVSATDRPVTTAASDSNQSQDPFQQGSGATSSDDTVITNAIQTDAAVNPGNSGGALVDAQGRVIGVPSSIASLGGSSAFGQSSQAGSIGLGFAIPIDEVKDVVNQLIDGGTVAHSWLGVSTSDSTVTVDGASRDAAALSSIIKDSPAAKAGLKSGDAVIAVDGKTVNSKTSLIGALRERTPGTVVTLTVVRSGKAQEVKVTLGTKPATTG